MSNPLSSERTSYGEDWHLMEGSFPACIQSLRTGEIHELRNGDVLPDGTTWCWSSERGPLSAEEADDQDYEREYLQYRREQDADGGAAWQGLRYDQPTEDTRG